MPSLLTGIFLAALLLLYMVTYTVRFTDIAVVRTFGKISTIKTAPGLNWKWPAPIQTVTAYDNRLQVTTTTGEENPTRDGKNIIVTTAINWRIDKDDPYTFSIRCSSMEDAENKLKTRVRNDQKTVIGSYDFAQFVSTNSEELRYDEIASSIENLVRKSAKDLYGIKIETVKLQSITLPQRITENVFEAMKKERQAVAARYTSEGESAAQQIKDTAEGIAGTIRSFANAQAAQIVSEGHRRALENNTVLSQDQELASFLLLVRNLPTILKDRTTVILDAANAGLTPLVSDQVPAAAPTPASRPAQAATGMPLPEIIQAQ